MANSDNAGRFGAQLAYLATLAREGVYDPEWQAACDMMTKADDIIPPAELVASAFLPEVGTAVQRKAARECAEFIMHNLRIRAAEAALFKLHGEYPNRRRMTERKADGWSEDEVFAAWNECDKARDAFMRRRAKLRRAG